MNYVLILNLIINSSIISSLLVVLIFIIKRIFKSLISAKWHYIIWFALLLRLAVPYMVHSPFNISDLNALINAKNTPISVITEYTTPQNQIKPTNQGNETNNRLEKLFKYINSININYKLLFLVWITGTVIFALYSFAYNVFFWLRVKNGKVFTDHNIINLLEESKEKLGVHTNISIIQTSGINIPAIFGVTRPWLLIPEKVLKRIEYESLRYVILHELAHLKRKDIIVNWIALILQIIHWFNPFVWYAFYKMRADREIACDETVLMHLGQNEINKYGHALLNMVEIISGRVKYAGIAGILEDKSQIHSRISRISRFNSKNSKYTVLAIAIVIFLGSSIIVNANNITVTAENNNKSISTGTTDSTQTDTPTGSSINIPIETGSGAQNAVTNGNKTIDNKTSPQETLKRKIHNTDIKTELDTNDNKKPAMNSGNKTRKEVTPKKPASNTMIEKPVSDSSQDPNTEPEINPDANPDNETEVIISEDEISTDNENDSTYVDQNPLNETDNDTEEGVIDIFAE